MTFSVEFNKASKSSIKFFLAIGMSVGLEVCMNACTKEVVSKVGASSTTLTKDDISNVPLFANSYQVTELPATDTSDEPKKFLTVGNNLYFLADGGDNNQKVFRFSPNGGGLSTLTTEFQVYTDNAQLYALGSQIYLLNNGALYKLNGTTFTAVQDVNTAGSIRVLNVNSTSFLFGVPHYASDIPTCPWASLMAYSYNGAILTALKDSTGKNLCLSQYQNGWGNRYPSEDKLGNNISNVASTTAFGPFNDVNSTIPHVSYVGLWDNNTMALFKAPANPYPYIQNYYRVAVASDKSKMILCSTEGSGVAHLYQLTPNDFTELTSLTFDTGFLANPVCTSLRPFKDGFALQRYGKIVTVTGATPTISSVTTSASSGFEVKNDEIIYFINSELYRFNGSVSTPMGVNLAPANNNPISVGTDGAIYVGFREGSTLLAKWDGSTLSYFPTATGMTYLRNQVTPIFSSSDKVLIYTAANETPYSRIFVSDGVTTTLVSTLPQSLFGKSSFALGANLVYAASETPKGSKVFGFNTLTPDSPSRQIFSTNNDIGLYNSLVRLMARSSSDFVFVDYNDKIHYRDRIIDLPENYNEYYRFNDELYVDIDGALLKFVDGDLQIIKDFGGAARTEINDFWVTNDYGNDYRIIEPAVTYYLETQTRSLFTGKETRQASIQEFDGKTWTSIALPYPIVDGSYYSLNYASATKNGVWLLFDYYDSTGKRSTEVHYWNGHSLAKSFAFPDGSSIRFAISAGDSYYVTYRLSGIYHLMQMNPDLSAKEVNGLLGNVNYISRPEQGVNSNARIFNFTQTLEDGSSKSPYAYVNGGNGPSIIPDASAPFTSINEINVMLTGTVIASLQNENDGSSQLFFWSKDRNWYSGSSSCRVATNGDDWVRYFVSVNDVSLFEQSSSEMPNNGSDVFLTNGADCRKLGEFSLDTNYSPLQIGDSFYFIAAHNRLTAEYANHYDRIYKVTPKK